MTNLINQDKLKAALASIKARFENNTIHKMSDVSEIYVTGISRLLGMGFDGFVSKCASPEKFIIKDLIKLSQVLDLDIEIILKVVLREARNNIGEKSPQSFLKEKGFN